MDGAPEQPVRPVAQEVANVEQDRRARVMLRAGRVHGDRRPLVVGCEEFETRLAG